MIAKITVGTSLYGALAYNGQKVNEGEGRLLAVNLSLIHISEPTRPY